MLKAIVADDERKVCQLIQNLVDWDELNIDIISTADNGNDTFELIIEYNPEIVITDIRMPGLDGIELVKKVREEGLSPDFIIISGYRDFEYAHNALKLGVEEYLLKPIKKDELEEALLKIKRKHKDNNDKFRRCFRNSTILYPEGIQDIIYEDIKYRENFQEGLINSLFIKIDKSDDKNLEEILEEINRLTEDKFNNISNKVITYVVHLGMVCIISFSEERREDIRSSIFALFDDIKINFNNLNITIGKGNIKTDISEVSINVQESIDAIKSRIVLGTERIIEFTDIGLTGIDNMEIVTIHRENLIKNTIEALDKEGLDYCLTNIFNDIKAKVNDNPFNVFDICKKIIAIFLKTLKRMGLNQNEEKRLRIEISKLLDRALNIDELYDYLVEFINNQINIFINKKDRQETRPIRKAKLYINKHYNQQIKLDDVAQVINYNSSYLSVIFKKEVGMNFSDYLIQCRLDAAKDMLRNENIRIATVSRKVGYTDAKYFSKLFKKRVGIKPSEYRKLYS